MRPSFFRSLLILLILAMTCLSAVAQIPPEQAFGIGGGGSKVFGEMLHLCTPHPVPLPQGERGP